MPVPLSELTAQRLAALFRDDDALLAARLLAEECGSNLPFCADLDARGLERIRFAALKVSGGQLDRLEKAVELAKLDWRDLLMSAGFGYDSTEHERWRP